MSERSIRTQKDANMIQLTFSFKLWIYSLRMTLFGWFGWYLLPKMAHKMSQEFPTVCLDITEIANKTCYEVKSYTCPQQDNGTTVESLHALRSKARTALNRTVDTTAEPNCCWEFSQISPMCSIYTQNRIRAKTNHQTTNKSLIHCFDTRHFMSGENLEENL